MHLQFLWYIHSDIIEYLLPCLNDSKPVCLSSLHSLSSMEWHFYLKKFANFSISIVADAGAAGVESAKILSQWNHFRGYQIDRTFGQLSYAIFTRKTAIAKISAFNIIRIMASVRKRVRREREKKIKSNAVPH